MAAKKRASVGPTAGKGSAPDTTAPEEIPQPDEHVNGTSKYRPEYARTAEKLARIHGATDSEVAEFLGVTDRTIRTWKLSHPEFAAALQVGKDVADAKVEKALYQRALGYRQEQVKVFQYQGEKVVIPYTEIIPPDTMACMYWLNNRKRGVWERNPTLPEGSDDAPAPTKVTVGVKDARKS